MEKNACLYIRVSSEDQGNSVAAQMDKLKAYCVYNGMNIVDTLLDEDVSGGKKFSLRPGGSKVQEMIEQGKINCIVSTKIDRLFRNTADALLTVDEWNDNNIALHLADMGGVSLDTSSANGKFFFTIMASSAQYERDKCSERIKDVLTHKKNNMQVYSVPPLGFDAVGRKVDKDGKRIYGGDLVPNEQEMQVVKHIFSLRQGKMSMDKIAKKLNADFVQTKRGGGAKWHAVTVENVLKNKIYDSINN